jgi:endogenous inhibitor of DNA gyrase (YacG/DUF329 family)
MERLCFFCRKPMGVEKRAEMFCSPRCRELNAQLRKADSVQGGAAPPDRTRQSNPRAGGPPAP